MQKNPTIRIFLILCILFMITYALADGIRYRSAAGIIMASVSLLAFVFFILLARKLAKLKQEEEEEESIS